MGKNFIGELKGIIDDPKYGYADDQMMIKTGLKIFDYLNGNKGKTNLNLGIDAGKIITIIGKPGAGKSTFAVQIAGNILKRYEQSSLFVLDFEQAHSESRIKAVTGLTDEEYEEKVTIKQTGISTETVLEIVSQIKQLKLKYKKELSIENAEQFIDPKTGKLKVILPPTVVIVDSAAMMMPKDDMFTDEMTGQMSATQAAKANTQLMKRLVQPCKEANIIVMFINHINAKISTGMMPVAANINYLKQDETIPGGNAIQFLTNTLIKLVPSSKLDEDKKYQIKGYEVKVELIKSRTAPAGSVATMVYNQSEGFDDDLSLYDVINSNKLIKGSPVAYKLEGLETVSFRLSTLKQTLSENEEFRNHYYTLAESLLTETLSESSKLVANATVEIPMEEEEILDVE